MYAIGQTISFWSPVKLPNWLFWGNASTPLFDIDFMRDKRSLLVNDFLSFLYFFKEASSSAAVVPIVSDFWGPAKMKFLELQSLGKDDQNALSKSTSTVSI